MVSSVERLRGRAAVEAEHQAEADEPVAGRADAKIHILTFCTNRKRMGKENFGRHHFSPCGLPAFRHGAAGSSERTRESRRQRDDRLEVLQKEGLGDLCRHEKFQRRRQAGAHLVVEVVPVVEKGRPHIVVGGLDKARHDDEQADDLRQPRDEGTADSRKPSSRWAMFSFR